GEYSVLGTVDGLEIGMFASCDGLNAEYDVMTYAEGGENLYEHRLPGRLRYSTIKLTRPIDLKAYGGGQSGLATWFSGLKNSEGKTSACKTASIKALATDGEEVASWNLLDAYPFRWTGPTFGFGADAFAEETLELAHHGFID